MATLVELAHDAVLVRALDSRIVFWNRGAETLYGWSRTEAIGRSSHELLATRFPRPLAQIERDLAVRGSWEGELRHRTKAGDEVIVESRWARQLDAAGDLVAIMEINRDVTPRAVAEQELAADAARFRAIFDASLDAILLTAPDGRILAANAAAEAMYGRSEQEIVAGGRELLVDVSDPRLSAALRERERTGRFRGDLRALRRDGSTFEVESSSVVFVDPSGELRTSMVMHDVTERKRALESARESEARFQALADAAFEAIVIHDAGRILDVNRAACTLFGYTEEQLKAMSVVDLVSSAEAERVQVMIEGEYEESYETVGIGAGGVPLRIEVSARSISFEGRPARVATIRDVSEHYRAKHVLEEQNERLRELDALKSQFVALVSHELRTPLTSIMGYLAVLEAGETGPLDERQRQYLEIAGRNARRLRRLVDDLLFVARTDSGKFAVVCGPVDLASLAEEVVDTLRPAAADAGVSLRFLAAASPVVDADRDRIGQLLDNLVGNALKFTPSGGSVDVGVDVADGRAVLTVSDTGTGISIEDQPRLFEPFYRGHSDRLRPTAGAGLGLAIVKEIADAHRGTIRVESEPGRGTTFNVELPLDG
ncbi:MAG TPA: PAS domain S-box protein [Gaiellaceae bacterium]|nr:PAS domain S-box protein [Gaiellaceae bacterium]